MLPQLPERITGVLAAVEEGGGQGYIVGGALRDLMRGRAPEEWDIVATLTQKKLVGLFPGAKSVGGRFGTVCVPLEGGSCEITPCRGESGILSELSRRDFTINAMAYDGNILLDPFDGQRHFRSKTLCCVGDPVERFNNDPLCILRLFRISASLGFTAEWKTYLAATDAVWRISALPRDQVRDEIQKLIMSDGPQVLSTLIAKGGLGDYGFRFAPSLVPLADVPKYLYCRWWAIISLCGADRRIVGRAFGFSRKFMADLEECTRLYQMGPAGDSVALKQKLKGTWLDYAPVASSFAAVSPAFSSERILFTNVTLKGEPYRVQDLAVDGNMLRNEGIKGRKCGQVLDKLLAAVIKNPTLNREPVLLGLARGIMKTM